MDGLWRIGMLGMRMRGLLGLGILCRDRSWVGRKIECLWSLDEDLFLGLL